jgi:group I intron endonuclease
MWINKENGKRNVGSAVDLKRRLYSHFSISFLMKSGNNNMKISRALLKYGYSKFSLLILEYWRTEGSLKREQYYLDLLQPEYNYNPIAGSRHGSNHTEETKQKISSALHGEKHPLYGLKGKKSHMFGKTQSEETKLKKKV